MSLDLNVLKLLERIKNKIDYDLRYFDDSCKKQAFESIKNGLLKQDIEEYAQKAVVVLRSLPGEPAEIIEEHRAILLEACEKQNFKVMEIFYYTLGDIKRRENIIRYIKASIGKVALVTNHINPQTSYKKGKKLFKSLVKQNYIDVYKIINGELSKVY